MRNELIYKSTGDILDYFRSYQVNWGDKRLADNDGNVRTPSPAIGMFYELYHLKGGDLFTQSEYYDYCAQKWGAWFMNLRENQKEGLRHRLYGSFYPSAVDTVYAWALLVETRRFSKCIIDSLNDAVSKVDISVYDNRKNRYSLALSTDSKRNAEWKTHKRKYRGAMRGNTHEILLPLSRPKGIGNKRWYEISDFYEFFESTGISKRGIDLTECPFSVEKLESYARDYPHLICCPITTTPWMFVYKTECEKCSNKLCGWPPS